MNPYIKVSTRHMSRRLKIVRLKVKLFSFYLTFLNYIGRFTLNIKILLL